MDRQDIDKVLIVGGAGYIGSVLTRLLLEDGYKVTVFDRMLFGDHGLSGLQGNERLRIVEGDIRDITSVGAVVKGQDAVVLLAALVGEPACDRDPDETVTVNLLGSQVVVQACRYYGVKRILFASTDSCYGIQEGILYEDSPLNPISLYAELKRDMEAFLLAQTEERFCPVVLRLATIYGLSPRMRFDLIINILTMHAVTAGRIKIFGGKQWRPLVHVHDAARGFLACLRAPLEKVRGRVFNIGSNEQNFRIGELGNFVVEALPGTEIDWIEQPPDLRDYHVNFDLAARELGYKVHKTVADGILEIAAALRDGQLPEPRSPRYRNA